MRTASLILATLLVAACSTEADSNGGPPINPPAGNDGGAPPVKDVATLPPLAAAIKLTDVETLIPSHAIAPALVLPEATNPEVRERQLREGFGEFTMGAGEAQVEQTGDGAAAPAPGANRKRLTRFVHMADFQLADDESPARLASFDAGPPFESAWRPQEGHECRIVNAVVRTVNRINKDAPIDFVLLGGDNADNAQENELDWVLGLLGGSDKIVCDSGDVDDPVPGSNNDGKDPFKADGLDIPWYWVTGNHDVLNQGNFPLDPTKIEQTLGTTAGGGTRDYRQPGSPISKEDAIADPKRKGMVPADVINRVVAHKGRSGPEAHGLGAYAKSANRAYYSVDLGTSGIRLITLDTAAQTGASEGVIRRGDLEGFIKPEVDKAKADGKMVIFASHHAAVSLSDGSGLGGGKQADALTRAEWEQYVISQPHVLAHLAGHSHEHSIRRVNAPAPGTGGYWEIRTSAIADYPHQFRVFEIWDEDNGQVTFRSVAANYSTENDPVAAAGRKLAILDYTAHGCPTEAPGAPRDRNVILWSKKPQ